MSNKSKKSTIKLFRTFGNGPVKIVCLHGIFGPDIFDKFFDTLEETTYSVFVFSMFGYFDDKTFDLFTSSFQEAIKLDVEVGDTILVGRFKNKKMKVKSIGKDEHGMPTI